jgi:hypothetical protein
VTSIPVDVFPEATFTAVNCPGGLPEPPPEPLLPLFPMLFEPPPPQAVRKMPIRNTMPVRYTLPPLLWSPEWMLHAKA